MAIAQRYSDSGWSALGADQLLDLATLTGLTSGDRIYVWAAWKPYTITTTMTGGSGWVEITEFADGTVASGDSTGSVKIAAWYSTYTAGDGNPTLDFSVNAAPCLALVQVWSKGSTETWDTPVFATAAWPSQTTGTVSASSTVTVPNGSVAMCGIGLRNDVVTFTRPTTAIDVASGITWNGNYVESPTTHGTTTANNDLAADLGYRLVTTGNTGVTLRTTVTTLSTAETGSILWVVQGLQQPTKPLTVQTDWAAMQRANLW